MTGEQTGESNHEIHGQSADDWAVFYAFECIKGYPYNPTDKTHLVRKSEDGSDITVTSKELMTSWLSTSVAADGGEEFIETVAEKGTQLIESWFVETEPGKFKFDMNPASI